MTIGKIVRSRRDSLNLTRTQAAKKLGLSPNYLGLIERDYPTHISDNVEDKLHKFGARVPAKLVDKQNIKARKEAAFWRARMAKASKNKSKGRKAA